VEDFIYNGGDKIVFTNFGRQAVTWRLGSSLPDMYIQHIGIGSGSGTVLVTNTTLVHEVNRTPITGSPDFTEDRKVGFQADFNSVQMSGLDLTEFGLFHIGSATGFAGSTWQREAFNPVEFDGTNELQVFATVQVLDSGIT